MALHNGEAGAGYQRAPGHSPWGKIFKLCSESMMADTEFGKLHGLAPLTQPPGPASRAQNTDDSEGWGP